MDSQEINSSLTSSEQTLIETEVCAILKSLPYPVLEYEDLYSYAYIGLLEARKRFNPSYKVSFRFYARHRVRGAMLDGVRQSSQYGRTGYATLKSWLNYELNQLQTNHLTSICDKNCLALSVLVCAKNSSGDACSRI